MPHRDVLSSLMQRLVQLVGTQTALDLAREIPGLRVDADGNVLDYDRHDPSNTARLLIEQYEVIVRQISGEPLQASTPRQGGEKAVSEPPTDGALQLPLRIVVVDDHVLVREGLVGLISSQPDLEVVGEAGSVREALALVRNLRPDLILMDFSLPDGTGDEATRVILSTLPNTKIIFLTVHDDDERLFAAISAGAVGYLLKSIRSADLLSRLRGVMRGDVTFSPSIGQRILEKLSHLPKAELPAVARRNAPPAEELTEREIEILRLIVQGFTNRQIADALRLSVRTVEYHRANLTSKLDLHSRADLVRYAAEHGLLTS
jgi:two-component system, NarL family, response regulator NreC